VRYELSSYILLRRNSVFTGFNEVTDADVVKPASNTLPSPSHVLEDFLGYNHKPPSSSLVLSTAQTIYILDVVFDKTAHYHIFIL
jgi:hypothetical protein